MSGDNKENFKVSTELTLLIDTAMLNSNIEMPWLNGCFLSRETINKLYNLLNKVKDVEQKAIYWTEACDASRENFKRVAGAVLNKS